MQGWPISAWRDTYSGGGYVINLKGEIIKRIKKLLKKITLSI